MNTFLVLIIVLSVLIFVHELGHFAMAKLFGAKVEEFGFGFPPRIFGVKKGETTYSVNWIPLGGFVRIQGENGSDGTEQGNFSSKKPWQRAVILSAGVFMNLVLAWFLLTVGYTVGLPAVVEDVPAYAKVSGSRIQLMSVLPGSAAEEAGLKPGDTVLSLDGSVPGGIDGFRAYTGVREGQAIELAYERDGAAGSVSLAPRTMAGLDQAGFGVAIVETGLVSYPVWLAPIQAAGSVAHFVREILSAFGGLIRDMASGQPVGAEFSGPVGIAVITAEASRLGFRYLLQFVALLSVNLAIVNILPLPALDGGRLVFLAVEKIRRRAVSPTVEAIVHNTGFALLMVLVVLVTYRDIINFSGRIRQAFGG